MDEQVKKSDTALREEETMVRWAEQDIFQKTLEQTKDGKEFVFYDGPPFATGLPHYGHLLASTIKDVIPRYQTMKGRYVRRVWGWDCHGLPIEELIERELGLLHKKDIEAFGIEKFNEAARASVFRYDAEWKKMIPRLGRWVDMEHAYKTMDASYSESIWWVFKTLYDKGLIYQNFKSMHICPRCETTLSNNEIAQGYKDITDISVTAKFAVVGKPGTFILAWTTTPWTLPGNVALALNPDETYVDVRIGEETFILASALVEKVMKDKSYEIVATRKGSELVGTSYEPIFKEYSENETLENRERGWKVYAADFVTMDSGTGVVHIAPAFGEDDMALGKKEKLPFVQHVGMDGRMKEETCAFPGAEVKPRGDHQATDIQVIKHLAGIGALFAKEKLIHSYPHCWRCDAPLLNYAAESWFVKSPELKDHLLEENKKTSWVPENIRDGRFGKWLENTRDWAISRSRYWGAPLPVWVCTECDKKIIIGSRAELATHTKKSGNKYFVMRHGQAKSNVEEIVSSNLEESVAYGLTDEGRSAAEKAGNELKAQNIEFVVVSPFARTQETAQIVVKALGLTEDKIVTDARLSEINTGVFNGKPNTEYRAYFSSMHEKFTKYPEGGETLLDVKRRVMGLLSELEEKYQGKNILIVTHEYPVWMLVSGSQGHTIEESVADKGGRPDFIPTAGVLELPYIPFSHNGDFEFDVHRPYIDRVPVVCSCGGSASRVPYVFDCWFESGSMPYAQVHYPFENKELFEKNFPADFIGEGADQTRGWFYSLLVLAVGLFDKSPFKNVVVNGLVLAEDGQKMSKKLKNYPDPTYLLNRYGADALRYYLLASPVVHAEDLAFSEKGVDEVVKKNITRVLNVLSFYEMYGKEFVDDGKESGNPLDIWILSRLAEVRNEMTASFDDYELDRAVKPLALFIDDLSTWYVRRSRDRFKSEDQADRNNAIQTTHTMLLEFSKVLAPIMPFLAEHIYERMHGPRESVHLEVWPEAKSVDQNILESMKEVRRIVSLALEARVKAGVKVRQPLARLVVKGDMLRGKENLLALILDEVNVKEVAFDTNQSEEVVLDTTITPALKKEGQFRELVRAVQDLRKTTGLMPSDVVVLQVTTDSLGQAFVLEFASELKKATLLRDVVFVSGLEGALDLEGISVALAIAK